MTHADTRAAILRGDYYERHVKPLCSQARQEQAAADDRAVKAAKFKAKQYVPLCGQDLLHQGRVLPEEIEAL